MHGFFKVSWWVFMGHVLFIVTTLMPLLQRNPVIAVTCTFILQSFDLIPSGEPKEVKHKIWVPLTLTNCGTLIYIPYRFSSESQVIPTKKRSMANRFILSWVIKFLDTLILAFIAFVIYANVEACHNGGA